MTGLSFNTLREVIPGLQLEDHIKDLFHAVYVESPSWPKFVFPNNIPEGAFEFGKELFFEGLLSLPFPKCYLQRTAPNGSVEGYFALENSSTSTPGIVFLCVCKQGAFSPVALGKDGSAWFLGGPQLPPDHPDLRFFKNEIAYQGACLMAMVGFINTKGTKLERVTPKQGANAKRERQGKRLIPEYTIVKIDPEIIKTYAAKGGTHASPRPHLRRGHIRRLDEERKTVIRPTFVNAIDNLPPPPQYRVEKA